MAIGPWLVVRGTLIGMVLVIWMASVLAFAPAPSLAKDQSAVEEQSATLVQAASESCTLSDHFPDAIFQWCPIITSYAAQYSLDADLIGSIIWQESGGQPQAYSRSGAVGLMQVMPSDGIAANFQCKNGPCFQNRPSIAELEDPEFNIKYGSRMFANLVQRHGSFRDALKAYGPMDVGYSYADKVLAIYQRVKPGQ